ncbi:MAG TPA: TIGR03435 family protein [Bryobacteraceae bacterium]|jgi:uncharacterized protein (TIGR03435 family)
MRAVVLGMVWVGVAYGQAPAGEARFEVASVKPAPPDAPGMFSRILPDGGWKIDGATLRNLIGMAYGVRGFQVSGGPKWIDTDRFDIDARSVVWDTGNPPDRARMSEEYKRTNERLRNLLADRFHLTLHPETREQPVYALVVAKGGPKLQEAKESEVPFIRQMGPGKLKGEAVGLAMLIVNLSSSLDRRIIDKTGLSGKYTFELKWEPSLAADAEGATIFTALQEQLGLRLESEKGPVKFLVIDSIQRPPQN